VNAARLTPACRRRRVKLQAYVISPAHSALLSAVPDRRLAGLGINALGRAYELRVIASTVIGGAT
jgi:ribose transport system permease protein